MSSRTANEKHFGGLRDYRAAEGKTVEIPYRGKIINTVQDILGDCVQLVLIQVQEDLKIYANARHLFERLFRKIKSTARYYLIAFN